MLTVDGWIQEPRLGDVWSALREPLLRLSFADMKTAAASAGLPVAKLSHLRQTATGRSSKGELADAIDGLFMRLAPRERDRVTSHLVVELLERQPNEADRLSELFERVGWVLLEGEPVPLALRVDALPDSLPDDVEADLRKALRRYRDGDLDGAVTAIAGTIDIVTAKIYAEHRLGNHKRAPFHERVVMAHRTREGAFRASLQGMDSPDVDSTWKALKQAMNGAAHVMAAYRRHYGDVHGGKATDRALVTSAFRAAVFLLHGLSD
jgi:hypothetical protein